MIETWSTYSNDPWQVFNHSYHGDSNWKYVIDVAPRFARVLQEIDELSSIDDEPSRLLDDHDDESFDESLFLDNEVVHSSSTSMDEEEVNSSSDRTPIR